MKAWAYLIFFILLALIPFYLSSIGNASDLQFFAGRNYNNRSLDQLAKDYWQWWFTVPQTIPKDPKTGLHECVVGSDSTNRTIMLFDSYLQEYSTSCNVSSEKSILVPLLVGECDPTVPELRSNTTSDLWKCAADADEVLKFWDVTLDGQAIFRKSANEEVNSNLKQEILVRNTSTFTLNIPSVNHYDAPQGSFQAAVDGYYLHLKPLPPGQHILTYKIIHEDPNVMDVGNKPRAVSGKASYILNVS